MTGVSRLVFGMCIGIAASFTGCQKPTAETGATAKAGGRMIDETTPNRPAQRPRQVSDDFLYAKCVERDSFVYGTLDSGKKVVTDGAFLEVRDEISPGLGSLKTKVKRSWQISHAKVMGSLPRPSEYRKPECIAIRVVVDQISPNLRTIITKNDNSCLISGDYYEYVTAKYPRAQIYVSSPNGAVMVEDSGELIAAVMPIERGASDAVPLRDRHPPEGSGR
jgi:hypothetical protein